MDAVIKQCPALKEEIHSPYGKRLSGNEILDIICDGQCEEPKSYGTIMHHNPFLCIVYINLILRYYGYYLLPKIDFI